MKLTELKKQFQGTLYVDGFRIFYKPTKEEYAKRDYFCLPCDYADLYELHNDSFIISDLDTKNMLDCALIQELINEIVEYTELDEPYVEKGIEFLLIEDSLYIMKFNENFISYNIDYQSWELTDRVIDVVNVYGENIKDILF